MGVCAALVVVALVGCGSVGPGAAGDGPAAAPDSYVVSAGDTLYAIATRFGLDPREIARWNRLGDGTLIYPGQRLRLGPPRGAPVSPPAARADAAPVAEWQWPTAGTVVLGFGQSPRTASGVLIAGRFGQPVLAAAAGDVVYSGSGLTGYGQLVIIRHNAAWLSAYGHNEELLVAEGVRVRSGQQIARMGAGAGYGAALHFEIRRNGNPVDPLGYLPGGR